MADRPLAKVRVRWSQLSFSFWDNDRKLPGITLTKSWRDDKNEWHNQNISITRRDIVEMAHQLPRVIDLYDKTASDLRPSQPSDAGQPETRQSSIKKQDVSVETYEFVE